MENNNSRINRKKTREGYFIFLLIFTGIGLLLTHEFWFPSNDKAVVAMYDESLKGYNIFYEINGKIDTEAAWFVKAFLPLNELYITDIGKNNWRLVKKQIESIKEDNPDGRIESDLLEKILENHNKNLYPSTVGYKLVPSVMKELRIWADKKILKKR